MKLCYWKKFTFEISFRFKTLRHDSQVLQADQTPLLLSRTTLQSISTTSSLCPTMHPMWSLTNNTYLAISYCLKGLILFCVANYTAYKFFVIYFGGDICRV